MSRQLVFLVGSIYNQIFEGKLPLQKDFLCVLFYNMRIVKLNLHESMSFVIDECLLY